MLNSLSSVKSNTTSLPTSDLSALCHIIVKTDNIASKANQSASISQINFASRYTKPTAWVYDNLYEGAPIGLIFSPTTGLTFYMPIDKKGNISFKDACYSEKPFTELTKRMRSGNSILSSELGATTPIPNSSLANWIERSLGNAEPIKQ